MNPLIVNSSIECDKLHYRALREGLTSEQWDRLLGLYRFLEIPEDRRVLPQPQVVQPVPQPSALQETNGRETQHSHWFLDAVNRRLHQQNKNLLAMVVGETGEGKSYFALRTAECVDPEFTVDQVCFTPQEFIRQVRQLQGPGRAIVLDEAGLAIPHRNWMSTANKLLSWTFESFRFKRFLILSTLPLPHLEDAVARGLSHLMIRLVDRGYSIVYRIKPNYFSQSPPYRTRRLGVVRSQMPSQILVEAYENKRAEVMNQRYEDYEKKLEPQSEEDAQPKQSRADEVLAQVKQNPVPYLNEDGKLDYRKLLRAFDISVNVSYTVIDKYRSLNTGSGSSG